MNGLLTSPVERIEVARARARPLKSILKEAMLIYPNPAEMTPSSEVKTLIMNRGKAIAAAIYTADSRATADIAMPDAFLTCSLSPAPQYWAERAEHPEQTPNTATFVRKLQREATPMADVATLPRPTTIAVSTR